MIPNILVFGSTGKLGSKILRYSHKNKIKINSICCFKNKKKIISQSSKYKIKNKFILSNPKHKHELLKYITSNKINIIYFLDYGSSSLEYLDIILTKNSFSHIAIANKEMIIAGGNYLIKKFKKSNNFLVPLDSEHFSLINSNHNPKDINRVYITASGGPFYFKKKINLNKVKIKDVLSHPKWIMGTNNLIDSSNFLNKILEIFELSIIYQIPISKIDFLISQEAYAHSIILYNDSTTIVNCFENDMLITLIKPLSYFYKLDSIINKKKFLDSKNFTFSIPFDKRFELLKNITFFKNLNHHQQIVLMISNNIAQELYMKGKIKYIEIIKLVIKEISCRKNDKINLSSINAILSFIKNINNEIRKKYKL